MINKLMNFEFDKEIDSLMRQMAKGEIATKNLPNHLDADEISAFAENALPQKARSNAMEHLADCSRCRKILADVVLLNAEESSEIIHAAQEPKTIVAVPKIPWYRQLFVFPNLAYAMGFLTLAFSGIVGYVILQSVNQEQNLSVAQSNKVYDKAPSAKGASSDGDYPTSESYANSNSSAAANTTANISRSSNSANTAASAPVVYATPALSSNSTSAAAASPTMTENTVGESVAPAKSAPRESELADVAKKEEKSENKDKRISSDDYNDRGNITQSNEIMPNMSQQTQNRSQTMTPDTRNAPRNYPAPSVLGGVNQNDKNAAKPRVARKSDSKVYEESKPNDSKQVNGKTFQNKNGVWTDIAYQGGSTKNVKRNSDDYKKLDAGLRSYSDNLSGTVIVVWNGKAYKIQ